MRHGAQVVVVAGNGGELLESQRVAPARQRAPGFGVPVALQARIARREVRGERAVDEDVY